MTIRHALTLFSLQAALVSCFSIAEDPVKGDVVAPTPGGGIVFETVTTNTITLGWQEAGDDVSPRGILQYQVKMSTLDNLGTLENAINNGSVVKYWVTNCRTVTATNLDSNRVYYFTVLVRDEANNMAAYPAVARMTAAEPDTVLPVPGDDGTLSFDQVGPYSFRLSWTRGTDLGHEQTNLMYKVVRSASADIDTVANATNHGTLVQDWTRDIGSVVVGGLDSPALYFVNVLVRDEYGNVSAYTMVSQATLEIVATPAISPLQGSYNDVQTVSFSCATPGASYRYTLDGTTMPSSTNGTVYAAAFPVNHTRTVRVVAWKAGCADSAAASAVIMIHNGIIDVGGAGTSAVNGTYYLTNTMVYGKRCWVKSGGGYYVAYYASGPGYWTIANAVPPNSGSTVYYQYNSSEYPTGTGWLNQGGSLPDPSLNIHD